MEFDDIIGEKEEQKGTEIKSIDVEIKKDNDDVVCYNGLRLGTPKELKHLTDVSFEVLAELKRYKKRFGDIEKYKSCFIEFDDDSTEMWNNGKLIEKNGKKK